MGLLLICDDKVRSQHLLSERLQDINLANTSYEIFRKVHSVKVQVELQAGENILDRNDATS